jgi:hypothetical protein
MTIQYRREMAVDQKAKAKIVVMSDLLQYLVLSGVAMSSEEDDMSEDRDLEEETDEESEEHVSEEIEEREEEKESETERESEIKAREREKKGVQKPPSESKHIRTKS